MPCAVRLNLRAVRRSIAALDTIILQGPIIKKAPALVGEGKT
jgi:hypothetical protein